MQTAVNLVLVIGWIIVILAVIMAAGNAWIWIRGKAQRGAWSELKDLAASIAIILAYWLFVMAITSTQCGGN